MLLFALLLAAAAAAPKPPAPAPAQPESADSKIPGLKQVAGAPALLVSGVPALTPESRGAIERWNSWRSASLQDASADGSQILIGTRFGNTNQLHVVEQPLGMRTQLTFGQEPVSVARFLPGAESTIVYLQDTGGGEFYQLFKLDRHTLVPALLTDGKSRHDALVVSREGKRIAFGGTERNGKDFDVYVAESDDLTKAKRVTSEEGEWLPLAFAPGGKQLLVVHERAITDAELWVVNLENNEKKQLTPSQGKGSVRGAQFSPDGRAVYFVTDRGGDFNELVRLDLGRADAKPVSLTSAFKWDVVDFAIPADPGAPITAALVLNQDGYHRLYVVEPGTQTISPVALPPGLIGGLRFPIRRTDLLTFSLQTPTSPTDVYQLDLRTRRAQRWTRSELGPIDASKLVEPHLVRYPSADGVQVPAFVYRPRDAGDAKLPVLVVWHGGPEGQSTPRFDPFLQQLVSELGIAVVTPNVRGSDGYGKKYLSADDGVLREKSLADIGATFDWIAQQPELDGARIGVYGGSYGGYMTLASAAFFPDRVKAAVDVVGISSIPTFLKNTQAYRRDLRRAEYGDERDPKQLEVLERISPLGSADKIKAELFVIQGKNDPRVPQSEAEQLVQALRAKGRDAWYMLGLNEGHGFQKKENRDAMYAAIVTFLREKLVGAARAKSG